MSTKSQNKKGSSRSFVLYTAILIVVVVGLFVLNQASKNEDSKNETLDSAPSLAAQPVLGDKNAKVSIVEFGDYKCPSCKQWGETVYPQLVKDYIDTGKATFSYINVLFHGDESQLGALAGETMLKLHPDQFWAFNKKLFDAQPTVDHDSLWLTEAKVLETAKAVVPTLDEAVFKQTLAAEETLKLVQLDDILVRQFGVNATPTIMINDIKIANPFDYEAIKAAIDSKLK
ncbi:DsbA family protein [Paenibacillus sp. GSMTC-2017]|uniref:thioredoxin domain-containing protein n=1 Tax=Paenibacillus sp. GSMTC-2017 TaxID=2794350 RepID=UPI0018D688DB|nr:thioredoxin domain-containing protein [Paenibacillus sp. GSMTC-2017]MBH5319910.1 DsbA family protein [Paenibacillus sp. GSMTC-2017]